MRRPALVALLVCAGALAPAAASAATIRVTSDAALSAALAAAAPGSGIVLAAGSYAPVTIAGRSDLTLAGEPGATVAGLAITGSQRIAVSSLAVAPTSDPALVSVASSSVVSFTGISLDGGAGGAGASMEFDETAASVTVANSTFLHCATPYCIKAAGPGVLIQGDTFDSLDDTDAVHGFGSGTIRGNHMDHALPHGDGNHNDFIQIGGGGPWTIDANWFGVRTNGAASIWLDSIGGGMIHDVVISDNIVTGHYTGQYVGIFIGGDGTSAALMPRAVTLINNTIISGLSESLRFGEAYAHLPVDQRPLVVNNVGERLVGMCDRIRTAHNVFEVGEACSPTDAIGNPHLDANGAPTAASALLIDHGDPSAPPADFYGYARTVGPPDIGAIEFGATAAAAPPKVHAKPRLVAVRLLRRLHTLRVRVRTANSTRFAVTVLRNGRVVAKAAHTGSARRGVALTFATPRRGLLKIRVRISGPGGTIIRLLGAKARP